MTTRTLSDQMSFVGGTTEMARLVRSKDWSTTPLGPIEHWPQSLRTTVGLCLASSFPINIIWGPGHTQIYNDGYRVVCGDKHPAFLGMDYSVSWASAWPAIGEPFAQALAGETSFLENQRMFLHRNGYLEETFFTFSLSPIYNEAGGIGGLFHPVTETTNAMLSERRIRAVRDLTARLAVAKTTETVFSLAAETLAACAFDMPFALLYQLGHHGPTTPCYTLAACAGLPRGMAASPGLLALDAAAPWPVRSLIKSHVPEIVEGLGSLLGAAQCGPYKEAPIAACAVPVMLPGSTLPVAIMIAGASARLPVNESYRSFCELAGAAIGAALANAQAYEGEQRQVKALAAIDRAKTAFFSNVSHEFRTPLTLMLAPIQEALADSDDLPAPQRERLQVVHRNVLRVLKLVNALLDFSRVEAGRAETHFEPTDLASFTAELASSFRSACEMAALSLVVDCQPLGAPVWVDRDMWETIVLNLVSNAFKFTLCGQVTVVLSSDGANVRLAVRDTGVGISTAELPRVFERFHRIDGQQGRSHEGTGIGLALVESLATLHGGTASASSVLGQGSEFRVVIPLARASVAPSKRDLPSAAPATAGKANPYVEEALRWLPDDAGREVASGAPTGEGEASLAPPGERPRIVLAEDNADMRAYVARVLKQGGYDVEAVADGLAALAAAQREPRPDLVLADVMMPGLDGFGLLRQIRAGLATESVVVILLSARAGEQARLEGLAAGADDYIVKPFNVRELRARIDGAINLARLRRKATAREQGLVAEVVAQQARVALLESERRLEFALEAGRLGSWELDLATWHLTASAICRENFGLGAPGPGYPYDALFAQIHPDDRDRCRDALSQAIATRSALDIEHRMARPNGDVTWMETHGHALYAKDDTPLRMVGVSLDVTARKQAERRQVVLLNELNHRVKNTLAIVQSIALQTQRNAKTPADFTDHLMARIAALARAHDLLTKASWGGASLADVIDQTLAFHKVGAGGESRAVAHGPPVTLSPNAAVTLNMAFHELATNSVKFGALSVPAGRVTIDWRIDNAAEPAALEVTWQEAHGPKVEAPMRHGFGSRLIQRGLAGEFGGAANLDFAPEGVRCQMRLPVSAKIAPAWE